MIDEMQEDTPPDEGGKAGTHKSKCGEGNDGELEGDLASSIEKGVKGILNLSVGFVAALWVLSCRKSRLPDLIDPGAGRPAKTTIRPYTFLVLSVLPASIYYQAVAASVHAHHWPTFDDVGRYIGASISQEYSVKKLLVVVLPIVLVTALMASLFSRTVAVTEKRRRGAMLSGTCFAFGFCFLCFATAGVLPILLRMFIPEMASPFPGVLIATRLPLWAQFSGLPLAAYAIYSCGSILSRTATYLENGKTSLLKKLMYYFGGYIGMLSCLLAVFIATIPHPERFFGADKVLQADSTTFSCLGSNVYLSPADGTFEWTSLLENDSDESIDLIRSNPRSVTDSFEFLFVDSSFKNWSVGAGDVLVLKPRTEGWVTIAGTAPTKMADFVASKQEKISLKSIIFRRVSGREISCGAKYAAESDTKPLFYLRTPVKTPPLDSVQNAPGHANSNPHH
jgi:hypothetical protein